MSIETVGPGGSNYNSETVGRRKVGAEFGVVSKPEKDKSDKDKKDAKKKTTTPSVKLPGIEVESDKASAKKSTLDKLFEPKSKAETKSVAEPKPQTTEAVLPTVELEPLSAEAAAKRQAEQVEIAARIEAATLAKLPPAEKPAEAPSEDLTEGIIELHSKDFDAVAEFIEIDLAPETAEIGDPDDEPASPAVTEADPFQAAAETGSVRPVEAVAGAGGDGGNRQPPPGERNVAEPAPEPEPTPRPESPQLMYRQPPEALRTTVLPNQPEATTGSFNPNLASRQYQQELQATAINAERYGERRGLLVGLLVGGAIEHFRHKRKEHKQAKLTRKQFAGQHRQIDQLKTQQQFERRQASLLSQKFEQFRGQTKSELTDARARAANERLRAHGPAELPSQRLEKLLKRSPTERLTAAELKPEEPDEPLQLASNRRLETSAWHRIEIDTQTGKAVENPALAYGREYWHEHQAESIGQLDAKNASAAALAVGSLASTHQLPSNGLIPARPVPKPPAKPKYPAHDSDFTAKRQLAIQMVTTVPLWIWVIIIVLTFTVVALSVR